MQAFEDNKWMFEGQAKFLDGQDISGDRIVYATYPRCGSTFLRKYLQEIAGIATGSDMPVDLTLCIQMNSMKGEQIVDDSVWITKSHDPFPTNGVGSFTTNKIICCVRNPLDVIHSALQLFLSKTQDKEIAEDYEKVFPEFWNEFAPGFT